MKGADGRIPPAPLCVLVFSNRMNNYPFPLSARVPLMAGGEGGVRGTA